MRSDGAGRRAGQRCQQSEGARCDRVVTATLRDAARAAVGARVVSAGPLADSPCARAGTVIAHGRAIYASLSARVYSVVSLTMAGRLPAIVRAVYIPGHGCPARSLRATTVDVHPRLPLVALRPGAIAVTDSHQWDRCSPYGWHYQS
jgi:hypothetical protein